MCIVTLLKATLLKYFVWLDHHLGVSVMQGRHRLPEGMHSYCKFYLRMKPLE